MNLDLVNKVFNDLKENKFVQNFIKELSNYLEKNSLEKNNTVKSSGYNNLLSDDLTVDNTKIISKYKNEMLIERNNILQNYYENSKELGEMYYIYDISKNTENAYNLTNCSKEKSSQVITKKIEELPEGAKLGSVLRMQGNNLVLDLDSTKNVENEISKMTDEKIEEQTNYLESKRIEGHKYEVGEKYSGRIWLYDLNNSIGHGNEGIEEIDFPKDLYEVAKEGDVFTYKDGKYQKQ